MKKPEVKIERVKLNPETWTDLRIYAMKNGIDKAEMDTALFNWFVTNQIKTKSVAFIKNFIKDWR